LSVLTGVAAAWTVVRSDLRGRGVLRVLFALPLAIPSYLSAFAWVSWHQDLAGFWGAVLVLTMVSYPFVYLPTVAALRHLDPAQEEVARSLGRSRPVIAVTLTLRQIRSSITAGALLVALYVLSDFGAVAAMPVRGLHVGDLRLVSLGFNRTSQRSSRCPRSRSRSASSAAEARARGTGDTGRVSARAAARQRPCRSRSGGQHRWRGCCRPAVLAARPSEVPRWPASCIWVQPTVLVSPTSDAA
jgi:iron(III) transport system permease protein